MGRGSVTFIWVQTLLPCGVVARKRLQIREPQMEGSSVFVMRTAFGSFWGTVIAVMCTMPSTAIAMDPGVVKPAKLSSCGTQPEPILQSYEPLTGGYTYDSNDTGFLDVNLSLKIRLLPWCSTPSWVHPYFAMATRFGFYWGSRDNSPVIGKSYNPLLLIRLLPNKDHTIHFADGSFERGEYIDLIPYAHQSNGQLIHTQDEYNVQLKSLHVPSYTNNFIHRGWDYMGLLWKKSWLHDLTTYLEGRYFFPDGFLQGPADEYHSWENNPQGKPRRAVDGLSATAVWPSSVAHFVIDPSESQCGQKFTGLQYLACLMRPNLTVKYLTGYDTPFKYSTERVELGFQGGTLPLAFWFQHGYMSSLAMYYEKVTSVGIEVRFQTF
ncbi:MAG: hypothetical protein C5B58_06870 [Acidobacteria bacterium]|nr:MAG: hypothetical protein C5B58_06870 [Acidobacteriota bacterium]